ncbi:MAG: ribonuclease III [Gemmatimonadetes bacterium]|nr:ribonuclease III [Gemmatimonadota bacterium]
MPPKRRKLLEQLEERLGMRFNDLSLLNQALVHRSYLNGKSATRIESNERMEFLGDSVLGLVVNEYLYKRHPGENEGNLTKIKSLIVSRQVLAQLAEELDLGKYLLLSSGEIESGGRNRTSIIADALEGVIGAIYLDRGLDTSRRFIRQLLLHDVEGFTEHEDHINYKSLLQERVQSERKVHPQYKIRREAGPDHEKTFHVDVMVSGKLWGSGEGKTKKDAEQVAARDALDRWTKMKKQRTKPKPAGPGPGPVPGDGPSGRPGGRGRRRRRRGGSGRRGGGANRGDSGGDRRPSRGRRPPKKD